jgi:hypothetical protein
LDSPLAWGAGVVGAGVVGGYVPTAGAAAAEGVIGGREEADKSSGASSAGNQGCLARVRCHCSVVARWLVVSGLLISCKER